MHRFASCSYIYVKIYSCIINVTLYVLLVFTVELQCPKRLFSFVRILFYLSEMGVGLGLGNVDIVYYMM